jgi:uncharacterized membrane protein YphA (DoxX/SURF4 family)
MHKQLKGFFVIMLVYLLHPFAASGQGTAMEETMYAAGKYNVTIVVVFVMLATIIGYLVWLDRRLRKLEKEENLQQ